jgi:hypothetical protein
MSIGNLKTEGNKGNNFPWQYKMLLGLQGIINATSGVTPGQARTPGAVRVTGAFVNPEPIFSFSVANVGTANGTVLGATVLKPGEIVNYDAGGINNFFDAGSVSINGTGTELLVSYIIA